MSAEKRRKKQHRQEQNPKISNFDLPSCCQDEEQPAISYRCQSCQKNEAIPLDVVVYFHVTDAGDPSVPPRFSCEHCGGEMWPVEDWEALVHGEAFTQMDCSAQDCEQTLFQQKAGGREKIGRNALCPCGSGKKYKYCCGKTE